MNNLIQQIIDYEQGLLSEANTIELFSVLVKNGSAWTLQGHYGRTAAAIIDAGYLDRKGNILISLDEEF